MGATETLVKAEIREYVAASANLYTAALCEAEELGVASGNRDAVAGILADLASDLALDAPNVARALPAVGGILGAASRMAFDLRDAARDATRPLGDIVPGIRALSAMLEPLTLEVSMFVVISGNFADGFKFYGPFDSFESASDSPEASVPGSWIATLSPGKHRGRIDARG